MSVLVKEVIEKLRLDIVYGEPELLEKGNQYSGYYATWS